MLERENRREKILEAKSREMKLKVRTLHRQEDTIDERPKLFQCKCKFTWKRLKNYITIM